MIYAFAASYLATCFGFAVWLGCLVTGPTSLVLAALGFVLLCLVGDVLLCAAAPWIVTPHPDVAIATLFLQVILGIVIVLRVGVSNV